MIKLLATLHKAMIDSEGESRVTLLIPLEYREQAMELMKCNDKVIEVTINKDSISEL